MVKKERIRKLNNNEYQSGPILYWMNRDMRVSDNWALLYAQELALEHGTHIEIVYNLVPGFLSGTTRQFDFKIEGLKDIEKTCQKNNIPFSIVVDTDGKDTPKLVEEYILDKSIGALVTDFSPLRISRKWADTLRKKLHIPMYGVDTHNIIPVWVTSPKQEFGAYTIRPKIHKLLQEYLEEFDSIKKQKIHPKNKSISWNTLVGHRKDLKEVPSVSWLTSGETAALKFLKDFLKNSFLEYGTQRNDPNKDAQSNLSPYLHYGQLSPVRVALEVLKHTNKSIIDVVNEYKNGAKEGNDAAEAFLEELIIRRELADNFCFYNENYDNTECFPDWAKKTHQKHKNDVREFLYTKKQFEKSETHDELWNACQNQMVQNGKMHGYMRMYWAKKILEWTKSAEEAMDIAIYLNDTYELDGRDPNGYAGIAWSIGGLHDKAWFERPVFGQIRYMNYNGCKSKFDVISYIKKWT